MSGLKPYNKPFVIDTLLSGTLTATTSGAANPDYAGAGSFVFELDVTAATGTAPTLDVVIQDTIDGTNWFTVATFTQVTATGASVQRYTGAHGNELRAVATVGGTTPSFTVVVRCFAQF